MASRTCTTGWTRQPIVSRAALAAAWQNHVPAEASALHARWWELETWLRTLVDIELKAKYGADWLQ